MVRDPLFCPTYFIRFAGNECNKLEGQYSYPLKNKRKPEDHWSCIAHLSAEDMLKSGIIEEKKFKSDLDQSQSVSDLDLW